MLIYKFLTIQIFLFMANTKFLQIFSWIVYIYVISYAFSYFFANKILGVITDFKNYLLVWHLKNQ